MRGTAAALALVGLGAHGCDTSEPGPLPTAPIGEVEGTLPPLAELARLSLDLRGVRPSLAELRAVAADPAAIEGYREAWLTDPRFAERMAWLWNDHLQTAVWPDDYDRLGTWTSAQWRAVGWEPLATLQLIVEEDRPFTELVEGQQLATNDTLAGVWGESAPGSGDTWVWGGYSDGRPMAGILSSRALWLRYTADFFNYNRQRANMVSRVFLCADFFDRSSSFSLSIDGSVDAIERAVAEAPSCTACHAALDPLASFFAGIADRSQELPDAKYIAYSPMRAEWYSLARPPRYYGQPGRDLADLGHFIAEDRRFLQCGVSRFYESLTQDDLPRGAEADQLVTEWEEAGLGVRPLVATIVSTPAYRRDEDRVLTTEQLGSSLSDLLGLPVTGELDEGLLGLWWSPELRVMGGGTDDETVLTRVRTVGLGNQVLLQWSGRKVAEAFVAAEIARPAADRVLVADPEAVAEAAVRADLAAAASRFFSALLDADDPEVDRLYALWGDSGGPDDPAGAWVVVIQALVRHPRTLVY